MPADQKNRLEALVFIPFCWVSPYASAQHIYTARASK